MEKDVEKEEHNIKISEVRLKLMKVLHALSTTWDVGGGVRMERF